jgi:hypothetical protein
LRSIILPSSRLVSLSSPAGFMDLDRPKLIGLAVLAGLFLFLLGFLPQWSRARNASRELAETRQELRIARLESRLGAALTESLRGNYERARQLTAEFYTGLQGAVGQVEDPARRRALEGVQAQRDEMITLLSRAQPESTQRLMLLYTAYHAAVDPADRPLVTPPPPALPAPTPAPPSAAPAPPPPPAKARPDTAGKR